MATINSDAPPRTIVNAIDARLITDSGVDVGPQNPLSISADSIYSMDLDLDNCDNNGFSLSVTNYFEDLKTVSVDASATNPKSIKLWFNRTIQTHTIGFGCDDLTKSFSNIKLSFLGSGEEVRYIWDGSADSTKRNSYLVDLPSLAANGVLIEFYTADEIGLSNIFIAKFNDVFAQLSATKDDDTVVAIGATGSGNLRVTDAESGLAIAKGDVQGHEYIHKFGRAPDFDTGDGDVTIWDGADDSEVNEMQYNYSTTAIIDSLSSADNGDTQAIEVLGLDGNYELVSQTVSLTGQTRKALTTNLLRVKRLRNIGSTDNAGEVYCYEDTALSAGVPVDTTKVRAAMVVGNNQTEMAIYTVPAGKTGYLRQWFASSSGAKKTTSYLIKLKARPVGQVFQLNHSSSISDESPYLHTYIEPVSFAEKTDIEMTAALTAASVTGAAVSAGFDLVLVDNTDNSNYNRTDGTSLYLQPGTTYLYKQP